MVYVQHAGKEILNGLDYLKTTKRRQIAKEIDTARAHGDLSENAEYHAAKESQSHNEARIEYLESQLGGAKILEYENIADDKVYIGATVTLANVETEEEVTYTLVSEVEADIEKKRISVTSPVGRGLLGKEEGAEVTINTPGGVKNYEIIKIRR